MNSSPETAPTVPAMGHIDLPIGKAAWDVLEIEPEAAIPGDFDVSLGDTFTDPEARAGFGRRNATEALHSYHLRDVTLDASLMLLLKGRSRITETRYQVLDHEYAYTLVKPLHPVPMDPGQYYVIGCNRVGHNYYHWMVQAIPAIDWTLRRHGRHRVTLALPPLLPWQEETLALLGYDEIPRLTLNFTSHYLLPQAEFSDFLGARMSGVVSHAASATFRRLAAAVPWTHGAADEIYVARTDAQNRVALNEAELIDLLDRQGVRIIVPGTLSVAEQIAAFRAARLVIGPHGAGMTNIAFCQPRSFVYELVTSNYPNSCFSLLAQSVGLNYFADIFEGGGEGDVQQQAWRIDLDVVTSRLNVISARIAAVPRIESAMTFLKRTQTLQPDETVAPVPEAEPKATATEPPRRGLLGRFFHAVARPFSRGGAGR
jgi:hypothetical protein